MKEQKKQDKQLDLIQRLEKELKSSEAKPALSVFVLPVGVETNRGIYQMVSRELNRCFEMDGGKLVFPIDDGRIVEHEEDTTNNSGIVSWLRRGDWERCHVDEVQGWDVGHAYMSKLLRMLAPIIEPKVLLPSDTTRTSTAMALLKVVFGHDKKRDNWSKFLRLRGAWNDQDEAKRWVVDNGMLDFNWNDVKNPTMFGVDFGQSMEPSEVRKEQREAKYWWIDIPDLTGLLGSILPVMYRFREKYLLDGMTKTEAVMWGLKKDIARNRLAVNTSNTQLSKWYGVNIHTIENAVAMLEDDERSLIPYGIESKKALNRSVRATKDSKWYENRKDQDKEEQQRERLTKLYRDYAGFSQNDAEDKVDGIEANKLQEEIESCMENLQ